MGSVGAQKVLRCPLPPSEASWAPLTPRERGNDFQGLVRLERTASQHLEGIMLLLPEGETQGVDDGGVTVCVWTKLCLIYTEWLNYIVFLRVRVQNHDLLRSTELNEGGKQR